MKASTKHAVIALRYRTGDWQSEMSLRKSMQVPPGPPALLWPYPSPLSHLAVPCPLLSTKPLTVASQPLQLFSLRQLISEVSFDYPTSNCNHAIPKTDSYSSSKFVASHSTQTLLPWQASLEFLSLVCFSLVLHEGRDLGVLAP